MPPEKLPRMQSRTRRTSVEFEEERAWVSFYAQVSSDAAVAAEVLSQLEADSELKKDRLALYLRCKESLRSHKARQARNRRIGQAVRQLVHWLLVRPAQALARGMQQGCSIAVECLPETVRDTAVQAPRFRRDLDLSSPIAAVAESPAPRRKTASNAA